MHYLDTSVLAAYYSPEDRSDRVQRTLSRIKAPAISPLVEVELHCAIARKIRSGEMESVTGMRIFSMFRGHVTEKRFLILPLQDREFVLARDWIAELSSPLRVLDALHLAVAFTHGLVIVTADRVLAGSARQFGVKHRFIE